MFHDVFRGKNILVTGDTGFKGSWLSIWLNLLGANVVGFSSYLPPQPCIFSACRINKYIKHIHGDVRNLLSLKRIFAKHKFDMIFHLAAQPLVIRSYADPKLTFDTNVGGTVNVLECIRTFPEVKAAVIITSDKCYKNVSWQWGYRENDVLGGDDPYSASKAAAELVFQSYCNSFFGDGKNTCRMATARAGNVIGGGDWASHRIIPDCVRAWSKHKTVYIRHPKAIRPWQHVLEPISGYLWLAANLYATKQLHSESFNFGPDYKVRECVENLIKVFSKYFTGGQWKYQTRKNVSKETQMLKVSCDKALELLGWHAVLSFVDTVKMTAEWYETFYKKTSKDMFQFTLKQIEQYIAEAGRKKAPWVKN